MEHKINIKGISEGLLITLGEGEWGEIRASLLAHIDEKSGFLHGAKVSLEVGNHSIRAAEMGWLRDQLSERGLSLRAILSNSPTTKRTAQSLGLATQISKPRSDRRILKMGSALQGDQGILIRRTLRSGQSVTHPGHITVIGDVNPGAEVIAGGNVVVWGRLKGTVHAGADGDEDAVICALDLSPTQLRIAEQINLAPPQRRRPKPELARLIDGKVYAEPWKFKKK